MTEALASASALLLTYAGFAALSLAMPRHHRQLRPARALPNQRERALYRLAGWSALGLAALASVLGWGPAIGAVAYFGVLSAAALTLTLLLAYAPRWAGRLAIEAGAGLPLLALALSLLG